MEHQVKKAMQKTARRKLEQEMSDDQLQRERALQNSQLEAIGQLISSHAVLQSSNDDDVAEMDMVRQQLKMYIE